jgi:hypothetical protein
MRRSESATCVGELVKLFIDTAVIVGDDSRPALPLASAELIRSSVWLRRLGRECVHSSIWLGRPIIQPADMVRLQEVIYRLKPA